MDPTTHDLWNADLDLGARLDRARPRIDEEAGGLVRTLSRTLAAAEHELHVARTLRAKAEEEAEAIRAAARRDAADLLARTRNDLQTLLWDLSQQLDRTSDEKLPEPNPHGPHGPDVLVGREALPSATPR